MTELSPNEINWITECIERGWACMYSEAGENAYGQRLEDYSRQYIVHYNGDLYCVTASRIHSGGQWQVLEASKFTKAVGFAPSAAFTAIEDSIAATEAV